MKKDKKFMSREKHEIRYAIMLARKKYKTSLGSYDKEIKIIAGQLKRICKALIVLNDENKALKKKLAYTRNRV